MDEDYGTDLANAQADDAYYESKNMCPRCETVYDKNDECNCEADEL